MARCISFCRYNRYKRVFYLIGLVFLTTKSLFLGRLYLIRVLRFFDKLSRLTDSRESVTRRLVGQNQRRTT